MMRNVQVDDVELSEEVYAYVLREARKKNLEPGAWLARTLTGQLWQMEFYDAVTSEPVRDSVAGRLRFPSNRPNWLGAFRAHPCGTCSKEVDDANRHECEPA